MKRILAATITGVLLLMSMACNNNSDNSNHSTSPSGNPVGTQAAASEKKEQKTITFATITGYYSDGLNEAAAAYEKLHPETVVKIEIINDNATYKTNFNAKMAAGGDNAPDIVHTNLLGGSSAELIKKSWLVKLNDFVNQPNPYNGDKTVFDGINSQYHKYAFSAEGDIASLPFDLVGTGFFYNKDIFDKLELQEPKTWEELLDTSKKLQENGYIPLAMSYAAGNLNWMKHAFIDWSSRSLYPEMLVLPGDARYDENIHSKNKEIKYDPNNTDFDYGAIFDPEKQVLAWKDKKYDNAGPAERKWWLLLKELAQYYQPGFSTMNDQDVYQMFISQKAAMFWSGSWQVGAILTDQKKLGDQSFKWGTFKFPGFSTPDPLFPGEPRGILTPGHTLSITMKADQEQIARAKDFLMYLYSPEVAQKVYMTTLDAGQYVQGPSLVEGVALPDEVMSYLNGFKVAGNMQYALKDASEGNSGLNPDIKTKNMANELKFYDNKITIDQFLDEKSKIASGYMEKYVQDNGYDLDPRTNP